MGKDEFSILLFAFFAIFIQESHGNFTDTGGMTTVFTPFNPDGSVNYKFIPTIVECCRLYDLKKILIVSFTGEGPSLSLAEHKKVVNKYYNSATPYGIKIFVQIGGQPLYETVQLAKYCNDLQVAGVVVLPVVTYKGNLTESVNDLRIACNAAPDVSCIFEELPFVTTPKVSAVEVIIEALRLRDTNDEGAICNFDGAALSMDSGLLLRSTVELKGFAILILGNFNDAICAGFQAGFPLSLNSAANIFPVLVNEIIDACMNNDDEVGEAKQAQLDQYMAAINNLEDTTFVDPSMRSYLSNHKAAYKLIWDHELGIRIPLTKASQETIQEIYDNLLALGVEMKGSP